MLEAGNRVPLDRLRPAMEDWFRRKGYLKPGERLEVTKSLSPDSALKISAGRLTFASPSSRAGTRLRAAP